MRPEETAPTVDEHGAEHHPSFGVATVSRVQQGGEGAALFDSDIRHAHYVVLRIHEGERQRSLSRDWVRPRNLVTEVAMSMAQWGQLVSSFGMGDGTPVTLTFNDGPVAQTPHQPRMAKSLAEVRGAANEATEEIRDAFAEVERLFTAKAGRKDMERALHTLRHKVQNAPSSMEYVSKRLVEHSENVVANATADIEAMALAAHRRIAEGGTELSSGIPSLALGEGDEA